MAILHGHTGGVTHLRFSNDGHRLYSGARKVSLFNRNQTKNVKFFEGWNASLLGCEESG